AAVIVTTWLAGTKPGALATALAILAFTYLLRRADRFVGQRADTSHTAALLHGPRLLRRVDHGNRTGRRRVLAARARWLAADQRGAPPGKHGAPPDRRAIAPERGEISRPDGERVCGDLHSPRRQDFLR